jgi:hypothetical protein
VHAVGGASRSDLHESVDVALQAFRSMARVPDGRPAQRHTHERHEHGQATAAP